MKTNLTVMVVLGLSCCHKMTDILNTYIYTPTHPNCNFSVSLWLQQSTKVLLLFASCVDSLMLKVEVCEWQMTLMSVLSFDSSASLSCVILCRKTRCNALYIVYELESEVSYVNASCSVHHHSHQH